MFIERLMILIRNPPISQSEGRVPCQPLPPELPTGADLPVDQLARARLTGGAAAMAHKEWEGTAHSGRSLHPYLRTNLNCGLTSLSVKPPENSGSRYGSPGYATEGSNPSLADQTPSLAEPQVRSCSATHMFEPCLGQP